MRNLLLRRHPLALVLKTAPRNTHTHAHTNTRTGARLSRASRPSRAEVQMVAPRPRRPCVSEMLSMMMMMMMMMLLLLFVRASEPHLCGTHKPAALQLSLERSTGQSGGIPRRSHSPMAPRCASDQPIVEQISPFRTISLSPPPPPPFVRLEREQHRSERIECQTSDPAGSLKVNSQRVASARGVCLVPTSWPTHGLPDVGHMSGLERIVSRRASRD